VRKAKYQAYLAKNKEKVAEVRARREEPIKIERISRVRNPNKQRNKAKAQTNRQLMNQGMTRIGLSDCLVEYAKAMIDPFDTVPNPCIPDNICIPSYKFNCKVESTFTVGLMGTGFVLFNPWSMAANDVAATGASIDFPIIVSTANYTRIDVNPSIARLSNGEILGFGSTSPFTFAEFGNDQIQMRLVAAGVEIEYIGELLNQSGCVTTLQNNGLQPFIFPTEIVTLQSNPRARTCANSKENRCYISYTPTNSNVLSYGSINQYLPSQQNVPTLTNHPLVIAVSGATPGITFRLKAMAFFEMQMDNTNVTPSESDPIGFPAFLAAKTAVVATDDPGTDLKSVLQKTIKNIATSISGQGAGIGMALGSIYGNPQAGRAAGSAAGLLLSSILGD